MIRENMFSKRIVDIGQLLNSSNGLKNLWITWTVLGVHMPNSKSFLWRTLYYIYATFLVGVCAVVFPITLLAYFWHIKSWEELVINLSLSVTIIVSSFKQMGVVLHHQRMLESEVYVKRLDERCSLNVKDRIIILQAIQKCNNLFALYFLVYFSCGIGYTYMAWINQKPSYNVWLPTFSDDAKKDFLVVLIYQTFCQTYTCAQNGSNDVYPLCYLNLIIAHLDALAERIKRIGFEPKTSSNEEDIMKELEMCITDHKNLLSFFEHIRPAISTTMFLQFFITALVLCLTIIRVIAINRNMTEHIVALIYLIILMFQIFPCCWYVNVLMEKSAYLTTAMYSCNWLEQNRKFRKILIIFMQRSQKNFTILAGNLSPVTLQTYLGIMRLSFSMFAIFRQMY